MSKPSTEPTSGAAETEHLPEQVTTWVGRPALDPEGTRVEPGLPATDRYQDQGELGRGGMGEVRRVHDRVLERTLAMKVLRAERADDGAQRAQFLDEARAMAGLEHPGIVPIHDLGTLPDGRPYFTMKEVEGRTLHAAIHELHGREPGEDGPGLRTLVEVFRRVCEAVAFAHARGVVHRDLKPSNIMIGPFGDVLVVDWGLATRCGAVVQAGQLAGTPEYMAPEAFLRLPVDCRLDVWALGVILHELLLGTRPFRGTTATALMTAILRGPPAKMDAPPWIPEALVALCQRMLQRRPERRPADAGEIAAEIASFLRGAMQREQALTLVAEAERRHQEAEALRGQAEQRRQEAAALAGTLPRAATEAERRPLWAVEDEAAALHRAAEVAEVERMALLQQSLTHAPTLPAAHAGLVAIFGRHLQRAEAARDEAAALQAERLLRGHLPHLEPAERQRVDGWLRGDGAVTLITDVPAEVLAFRCTMEGRRLVPRLHARLGTTPLREVPLPMGSWVLLLRAPGRAPVRYPVLLGRGERWTGVPPGQDAPEPIVLPGPLPADQRVIPAGWFLSGGAPGDAGPTPLVPLWCPGFVIGRDPVTNAEVLSFLQDLDARGLREASARHAPRRPLNAQPPPGILGEPGAWILAAHPAAPATAMDWHGAFAYAAWRAERDGLPWRLPAELEWEKAARGVDGRTRPWGEHADPAFALTREHHPEGGGPRPVWSFPADRSPYGVRGMGGNVRDWCLDPYNVEGPVTDGPRVRIPLGEPSENQGREARGAHLADVCEATRVTLRGGGVEDVRRVYLGFRIARSI